SVRYRRLAVMPVPPSGMLVRLTVEAPASLTSGDEAPSSSSFFESVKIVGVVKKDEELGASSPLVNDAGASTVSLTSIPLGGTGITARRLYRTENGGSTYR